MNSLRTLFGKFGAFVKGAHPVTKVFAHDQIRSQDPQLLERIASGATRADIEKSAYLSGGFPEALGKRASNTNLPIDRPLKVVCAAGDLAGERMRALNDQTADDAYFVILAGAGAHSMPPQEGFDSENFERERFLNPMHAHAAISNFSNWNSHTPAIAKLWSHHIAFIGSHCAMEALEKSPGKMNDPTIEAAVGAVGLQNVLLFHADLGVVDKMPNSGFVQVGTGTGAPLAAINITLALRQEVQINTPLDIELAGFDGTSNVLGGDLPEGYAERLKADKTYVRIDGEVFEGQGLFVRQTQELIFMKYTYPELIGTIEVDNPSSFNARIFNGQDMPRKDFEIWDHDMGNFVPAFEGADFEVPRDIGSPI